MNSAELFTQPQWAVGVVVPARDEEASIGNCIQSITQALDACPGLIHTWIAIVADSCRDRTVERAREALGSRGVVLECAAQSPGIARRIGAEAVLGRFAEHQSSSLWIANTDADSAPPRDWISGHLSLAAQGYCAVAGIVRVESIADLEPAAVRELLTDYSVDPDGSHSHVHGANFGIRADAYLDAGGWSHLALAEDHCLWRRVRARDWRVVSSTASVVTTSGRLTGRDHRWFRRRVAAENRRAPWLILAQRLRSLLGTHKLDLPLPGHGHTGDRHPRIASVCREDLALARLIEAAQPMPSRSRLKPERICRKSACTAVWAADGPTSRLEVERLSGGQLRLQGVKHSAAAPHSRCRVGHRL